MKFKLSNGRLIDYRKVKRLLGHHLRDYRTGKLPMVNWAGRRPPSVTWRKHQSNVNRQRNWQKGYSNAR